MTEETEEFVYSTWPDASEMEPSKTDYGLDAIYGNSVMMEDKRITPIDEFSESKHGWTFTKAMSPVHIFLKTSGILPRWKEICLLKNILYSGYSCAISVLVFSQIIRYFWAYDWGNEYFGPSLSTKLSFHALFVQNFCTLCVGLRISRRRFGFTKIWTKYSTDYHTTAIYKKLYRHCKIHIFVGVLTEFPVTVTLIVISLSTYGPVADFFYQFWLPFTKHYPELVSSWSMVVINAFFFTYTSSIELSVGMWIFLSTYGLKLEAEELNKTLRQFIKAGSDTKGRLEKLRRRHLRYCEVVKYLDDTVNFYILVSYCIQMTVLTFSVYVFVFYPLSQIIDNIPVAVICVFHLIMITSAGTCLSKEVYLTRDLLYNVNLNSAFCSTETHMQYYAFMSRFTSGHIGLTAWHMFDVNKQTIKTVVLVVVSYTLILLKFGNLEPPEVIQRLHQNTTVT